MAKIQTEPVTPEPEEKIPTRPTPTMRTGQAAAANAKIKPGEKTKKPLFPSLSTREKVNFARHLSVMLDAGIPLHESLGVLNDQVASPTLKYVLQSAIADVADGLPLHAGIGKFPKLFDTFFCNAINVGESSGTLASTLTYLAVQLEKSEDLKGKVTSALFYPAIVFVGALGIGIYLAFFLLPKILPMFISLGVQLPATTRLLLFVSGWMTTNWFLALIVTVALIVGIGLLWRILAVRYATYQVLLRLPVFGPLIQNLQTAKFSRILGTLLSSGVTIVTALNVTAESTDNPVYKKELEKIGKAMERGETIGAELRLYPRLFSSTTVSMVGIGERTGKLSPSLIALAEFTEREVDLATRNLSTLIEPVTLLIVGALVGFIALSIITPIYQITQGIHA